MAYNASNVTTAKQGATGTVWRAPKGTTLPTDATTSLASAFINLGHVSEDGYTVSDSRETQEIKNMDGVTVYAPQTGITSTIKVGMLEALNVDVLKTKYGTNNVSGTLATGIAATLKGDEPEEFVWVFESLLRDGAKKRLILPVGKVTETGDEVYKNNEPMIEDFTITASADSTGALRYEYIKAASSSGNSGTSN